MTERERERKSLHRAVCIIHKRGSLHFVELGILGTYGIMTLLIPHRIYDV